MTTAIEKVNPKDYGLEESSVATIEQAFQPKIIERDALVPMYEDLVKQELTPELCKSFKELRLKMVKVRTGIADIHKTQKAYFLAAGRFVDAWKNKETEPIEQMESKLKEGEEYFERLEAKRIADLEVQRIEALSVFTDILPNGLGLLSDEAFTTYLTGAKVAYEARIAEEKRIEDERIAKEKALVLHNERREQLIPYWSFVPYEKRDMDFSTLTDDEWKERLDWSVDQKRKDDEAKEKQRLENERLKAEAKSREKALASERKAQEEALAAERAKADAERKAAEVKAAEAMRIEKEKAAKLEAELKAKADAERKAQEEALAAERAKADEAMRIEKEKAAKLEAELKAKADAEAKKEAEAKKAANAPDLEKLTKLASDLLAYELPTVQGEEAKKVIASTKVLLEKVSKFITEKSKSI